MKNQTRLLFIMIIMIGAFAKTAFATCPGNEEFSIPPQKTSAGYCVGIRYARHPKAQDKFDGDLIWVDKDSGEEKRIGFAPYQDKFIAFDTGVLMPYQTDPRRIFLNFWSRETGETTVCNKKEKEEILARDVRRGKIVLVLGEGFIQVKSESNALTYYSGCRRSSNQLVFAPLTSGDRAILSNYGSGGVNNHLTDPQVAAGLPDILGRDEVIDQIIASLKTDNVRSTLLWGPAGTGKTSIAYWLAKRIANKDRIPAWLEDWSVYAIDLGKLNSEGLAGKAEEKMSEIINAASGKKVILLMDEFHQLIGMGGSGNGDSDVTELLKTNMANGQLAIIATLTDQDGEMAALRQKKALFERFGRFKVMDPEVDVLKIIYQHKADDMLKSFGVQFSEKQLNDIIHLTKRYIPQEHHPRVGIKIITKIAAYVDSLRPESERDINNRPIIEPTHAQIRNQIGLYGNVQSLISNDARSFRERVRDFKVDVSKQYIGNEQAIEALHRILIKVATGNRPKNRPSGTILFVGPSGVGKSYLAQLFADTMKIPYKEFAMNQFKEEASINNFLGAWAGYVGHSNSGGSLTKWIQDNPESVVNFDEVEKAHTSVTEVLLRLMENGKLEDNSGNEAIFQNGYIVMTSNFGLPLIDAYDQQVLRIENPDMEEGSADAFGFGDIPQSEEALEQKLRNLMIERNAFGEYTQAFLGRIDKIVVFHHFNMEEQRGIAELEIKKAIKNLNPDYAKKVVIDDSVREYILSEGFSFQTGARSARQLAQKFVVDPVAEAMIQYPEGVEVKKITLYLRGLSRGMPRGFAEVELEK